ncbi:MAG: hypothetical protein Fur0012_08480 [Elusimicrobiota bacterium]
MKNRRAQILIPSVLVIPSLLIFVYLLFETTKVSREKIRQQFAADSAAFIQMGDYTNFLNRTAYVNGAFPYRIFKDIFDCSYGDGAQLQKTDDSGQICEYKMLYEAGNFPKYRNDQDEHEPANLDKESKWIIEFDPTNRPNINKPHEQIQVEDELIFIRDTQASKIFIFWDPAIETYKKYAQVYSVLGTVEESQMSVFERLTERMNFFKKSFYLNAATKECMDNPEICGNDGLTLGQPNFSKWRRGSDMKTHFIKRIKFWALHMKEASGFGYDRVKTNPPLEMPEPGLFQVTTVSSDVLDKIGRGYQIYQTWEPGSNYFNVNLMQYANCAPYTSKPCVHATITSQCPALNTDRNNCVWPNPTPKYQTRLYP